MKDKKRLCIVTPHHWSAHMGGAEYQVQVLLDALCREDRFDIFYLTRSVAPNFKPEGYHIIKIADFDGVRRFGTFLDAFRLVKALKEIKPDVIYQRVGCAYTGISAYYARRYGGRLVWHISSDKNVEPLEVSLTRNLPFYMIENKVMHYGINHAQCIIAQTRRQEALLQRHHGRSAGAVIPNFHPRPREEISKEKPIKILFIGKLHPLKQPQVFVELAKDLADLANNVQFIMIGPPDHDRDRQQKLMDEVQRLKNFTYLGRLPQDEVNALLAQAHILVNTSLWEGFPNTFIQAWMRKVPVVSLNVNPDGVFDDKRLGFISGGYDLLTAQVRLLCENDALREAMGCDAQIYALKHFSEENIHHVMELLEE